MPSQAESLFITHDLAVGRVPGDAAPPESVETNVVV